MSYLLGAVLNQHFGWRKAMFASALPLLIFLILLIPFADPKREKEATATTTNTNSNRNLKSHLAEIIGLLKIKDFSLNCWGYTAYHFALGAYAFWGPTFLFRSYNLSFDEASLFFGAALASTGLIGTLVGGYWASWWQKKSPWGYSSVCAISIFLTVPFSILAFWSSNILISQVAKIISMFCAFLPTSPMNTLVIETSPSHLKSTGMAVSIFLIHMCGDIWSPEIVGRLADYFGVLKIGLSVLPIAFLVAAILWTCLAIAQRSNRILQ